MPSTSRLVLLHYDAHFEHIAGVTGQPQRWVAPPEPQAAQRAAGAEPHSPSSGRYQPRSVTGIGWPRPSCDAQFMGASQVVGGLLYGRLMLHLHTSPSPDALVAALAEELTRVPGPVLAREIVAVPAKGVERWISQRLSHHLGAVRGDGIAAGIDFRRPGQLLDEVLVVVSEEHAAAVEAWQPDSVVWPLLQVLDELPDEAWSGTLRHHLSGARTSGYRTARRLAGLFGSYGSERPELILGWASGSSAAPQDLAWQPRLWRALRQRVGPSPAELLGAGCARLREGDGDLADRFSFYGPSRLPAARLQVLAALAAHREVHLWLHHPGPALWHAVEQAPAALSRRDLTVSVRHPLLASLSRDVQQLQVRLGELAAPRPGERRPRITVRVAPVPAASPPDTLLGALQRALRDDDPQVRAEESDRSVQVHACHGRARQVEVLREVVLGLLAGDPTLEPRDVLVLCPDVEQFAPLVSAAFEAVDHPAARLRVTVADRSPRQLNPLLALAADLLELAGGRATSSQVLDLLGSPAVRRRGRLSDDDVEQLRGWAVDAGVRWGLDAEHRQAWGLPVEVAQGTWQAGLDRLLVGVALPEGQDLLGDVLPLDAVEGSGLALVGRVAELVDRVATSLDALTGPQPMAAWLAALESAVLSLGDVPLDGDWQLAQLRRELAEVSDGAAAAISSDASVDRRTAVLTRLDLQALLGERLAGRPTRSGFRTGGLTVCTLVPMRSVPHRVVCLLGMDDGAFPRRTEPSGDDLLAREPQVGERDPRSEDRQLLLDAVLSATDHLVVTFDGAHVRTGAPLPPAVPIGELLDAIDLLGATKDGRPFGQEVLVRHPLQPFGAASFRRGALVPGQVFSYDPAGVRGAKAAAAGQQPAPPMLSGPLPPAPDDGDVDLRQLRELLVHPGKGFLRQRLGVWSQSGVLDPEESLPITLDGLTTWEVAERLLAAQVDGTADQQRVVEARRGDLPPHALGRGVLDAVTPMVVSLADAAAPHLTGAGATLAVEVPLPDGRRVRGAVAGVHGDALVTVTWSRIKAKQLLRAWIDLVVLSASRPEQPWHAVVVGRGDGRFRATHTLEAPEDPLGLLAERVALRDVALRLPLPLPAGAAMAFAASQQDMPQDAARKAWLSPYGFPGDDQDEDWQQVFGGVVDFNVLWSWECPVPEPGSADGPTSFARLARLVWEPLLAHKQRDVTRV